MISRKNCMRFFSSITAWVPSPIEINPNIRRWDQVAFDGKVGNWAAGVHVPSHAAICREAASPASASASFSRSSGLIRNPSMPASKQA